MHWIALLILITLSVGIDLWLIPKPAQGILEIAVFYLWIFRLCFWVRKINPSSNCLFWAILCLVFDLIDKLPPHQSGWPISVLIAFVIRDELLEQYNQREPIHLQLSPVKTFFFSFYYFQYYLYEIAVAKEQQQSVDNLEPNSDPVS
ncbi:MAG: hypothetical protein WAN35_01435 [Terracidiphilus sp.]